MSLEIYKSYVTTKRDYLTLSVNDSQDNRGFKGGAKGKSKDMKTVKLPYSITTYMLTMGYGRFSSSDTIKLSDLFTSIGKITKIGSFSVKDKVVIGDTDYNSINLAPGKYTSYILADSLMIINDKLKIIPKASDVKDWKWVHSGVGVGVDGGVFGFYDLQSIEFINKKMKDNTGYDNNLPYIKCDNIFKGYIHAAIVDGSCIHDLHGKKKIDKEIKELEPFGVISSTITGDGGFECFVIDDMRAILLGGKANESLFNGDNEE
jgi:hypothetical protein